MSGISQTTGDIPTHPDALAQAFSVFTVMFLNIEACVSPSWYLSQAPQFYYEISNQHRLVSLMIAGRSHPRPGIVEMRRLKRTRYARGVRRLP
jgi:hypothetical protein